ncbi:MAG TPA: DUF2844 domain-containing protein [Terriglobales bacterium]|jgi:hypothetical protein
MNLKWVVLPGAVVLALMLSAGAQGLGQQVEAHAKLEARATYSMRTVRAASGTELREFVAPSGVIFGVAWTGPTVPDLQNYLGSHFSEFQAAAKKSRRRGPLYVHVGQLVVENSGHMRDFHGRAYLEDAIPPGTSAAVIQ